MHGSKSRLSAMLAATLMLAACTTTLDSVRQGAQDAFRNTLAFHFSRQFASALGTVIQGLASEGGYLDNPLVRILLPPPVGLVIDVARDLRQDRRAAVLEILMNRAAEHAIPGAGPVLQAALRDMDRMDPRGLFAAGKTATTDYLREKAGDAVHDALLPVISGRLAASGAVELYQDLLHDPDIAARVADMPESMLAPVAPGALDEYVTARAVDGLFKMLAQHEIEVRDNVARIPAPAGPDR